MRKLFTMTVAVLLLGCGGGGGSSDDDATDVQQEDMTTEHATDPADDPEPDPEPDAGDDAEPDTVDDPPDDVPVTDPPEDWEVDTSSACADAGGFCTAMRWDMCPPGYEPTAPDMILDCGGHCCVAAPDSTCTASTSTNCLAAEACPSCWEDRSDLYACEEGRICCQYTCE